ncbi:hypothetical protein MAC_04308 [Metarhizium acridum CQMa 102]|uniref:Uncharacterized protein n=1 Tax=Metarhizium acridum (strain CQMa 102) TaxID=655827 RepID=E9E360_METAQ|nr:uncharacterized protein MAC_04308 [Metarhizium acridum CQMa 102]EFY89655.1 hypothetical protein MAC_04308 [Metarhizium acridum CQMa 102]
MNPPPTTPTPRRFLLAKRPSASETPASQASQQFHSTPRFGSSSVPRHAQRRAHDLEDVDEDGDESYDESPRDEAEPKGSRLQDTIELKSDDLMSQDTERLSQNQYSSGDDVEGAPGTESSPLSPDRREAKRRRVSISPAPSSSLDTPEQAVTPAQGHASSADGSRSESESPESHEWPTRQHQPVFQPAPRFKPTDSETSLPVLPEAFSPQHRGVSYLPGGHAAQLQGWLSEVKGWEGTRDEDSVLRLTVDDVSPGEHMYLVRGRLGVSDDLKAYILAGEGRLTGLGRRAAVNVGSVVVIEQPVWEVDLVGECWTVGCNWSVGG